MVPFLDLAARDLYARFGDDIANVTLIFPSRRSALFFNRYLSQVIEKPLWQPEIQTVSDLMIGASELTIADSFSLVFKLHQIFCRVRNVDEPFDSFYFWGEAMLADFDQIDKYLVEPHKLFANISDLKEIDERFGGLTPEQVEALRSYLGIMTDSNESEIRERYLSVWRVLGQIYAEFREELLAKGEAYEGLAYRIAAQRMREHSETLPSKAYAFIGFNALNECEKVLFRYVARQSQALFYWDYDTYYSQNDVQEAGLFIRSNLKEFPNALAPHHFNSFAEPRKLKLIVAPSSVSQAKVVPRILSEMAKEGVLPDVKTAIVLPEEQLLLPVLYALPQTVGDINITMGYPVKETPAYLLVESLIRLQANGRVGSDGNARFYHRDVITVLNHPYIRLVDDKRASKLVESIISQNRSYPMAEELAHSELFSAIFRSEPEGKRLPAYLLGVTMLVSQAISKLASKTEDSSASLRMELEYLFVLYQSLNRLNDVFTQWDISFGAKVFGQIFRKAFAQQRVSFSGEPLAGLQVMGFLETRALDFENLIILSLNDDILPGNLHRASFITPSLRFAFGLPDYKHQDAIYSYYFYRLLQRAQRVYMVFSARADGLSSGEESRYVRQVVMESGHSIERIDVGFTMGLPATEPITVVKSADVLARLEKYISTQSPAYLSPSALSNYIYCSLRFYFRYIAGFKEPEEVAEEVDPVFYGKILHKSMELLYAPYNNQIVTADILSIVLKGKQHIAEVVNEAFVSEYLKTNTKLNVDDLAGRSQLVLNALRKDVTRIVETDIKRAPFALLGHETKIDFRIPFSLNGTEHSISLGGIVDRLEERDGVLSVLDYKTGNQHNKGQFSEIDDLFSAKRIDKTKEVFQIFLYSLYFYNQHKYTDVQPKLWYVRSTDGDYLPNIINKKAKGEASASNYSEYAVDFEQRIKALLQEMFDPSVPFAQTEHEQNCAKCPYSSICNKGI